MVLYSVVEKFGRMFVEGRRLGRLMLASNSLTFRCVCMRLTRFLDFLYSISLTKFYRGGIHVLLFWVLGW